MTTVEGVYAHRAFTTGVRAKTNVIASKEKLAQRVSLYRADGIKDASVKAFVRRINKVCHPFSRFPSPLTNAMLTKFSFYSTYVTESESRSEQ